MSEREIFWLGGAPRSSSGNSDTGTNDAFAAEIARACARSELPVRRFVAAKGPFGSWMVEVDGAGGLERVIWNGRERYLSRESASKGGGWRETDRRYPDADGPEAQLRALQLMLSARDD